MRVAVIGGIASGKSTLMRLLNEKGYNTVFADRINARLLTDEEYLNKLSLLFPSVFEDGKLNRGKLASLIFSNETERILLNRTAHPYIVKALSEIYYEPITFYEIPLYSLVKEEQGMKFDKLWFVYTDNDKRLKRLISRNNWTAEEAVKSIQAQQSECLLREKADFIFDNNGEPDNLSIQLKRALIELNR